MPLNQPSSTIDLRIITPAFLRALIAWREFALNPNPTQTQKDRAAWVQYYFYAQRLQPTPRVLLDQAALDGLIAIIEARRAAVADQARVDTLGVPPQIAPADTDARLRQADCQAGIDYLKQAFKLKAPNNVLYAPRIVADLPGSMRRVGQNALERCNYLREAVGALQAELMRADIESRQRKAEPVYERVTHLLPDPDADFNDYDNAWAALEAGQQSNIYEGVHAPIAGGQQTGGQPRQFQAGIYAPLPNDFAPGVDPNDLRSDLAP